MFTGIFLHVQIDFLPGRPAGKKADRWLAPWMRNQAMNLMPKLLVVNGYFLSSASR
jgi:hypothetical protein